MNRSRDNEIDLPFPLNNIQAPTAWTATPKVYKEYHIWGQRVAHCSPVLPATLLKTNGSLRKWLRLSNPRNEPRLTITMRHPPSDISTLAAFQTGECRTVATASLPDYARNSQILLA